MKKSAIITAMVLGFVLTALAAPSLVDISIKSNPFSPRKGPAKFAYILESSKGTSVETTIQVLNMSGDLIRTIVDKSPRLTGVLIVSDSWDGKDMRGKMASNGRYILRIEVRDSSGTKQFLNPIVLVK
jgi:flagellar hook assembly protein FlgD